MILLLRGIVTKNIALSIETHKEREDKTMKVVFSSLSLFVKFLTNKINKFDKNSARLHDYGVTVKIEKEAHNAH